MSKREVSDDDLIFLRSQGLSYRAMQKETGISHATIHRRLRKFAGENRQDMKKSVKKPLRIFGVKAPEQSEGHDSCNTSDPGTLDALQKKVARLERELREAKMRADLYNEIINVAEQKFDIQIRKKAGTKQ